MNEEEVDTGDPNAWLATFGDLITLLMTFFVLMLSFCSLGTEEFTAALDSIDGTFGSTAKQKILQNDGVLEMVNPQAHTSVEVGGETPPVLDPMKSFYEEVVEYMTQREFAQFLMIKKTKHGFVIKINSDTFFDEGQSILKKEQIEILEKLADLVRLFPNNITIEGHIGKSFTPTDEYPSSVDLSIARAKSTCQYFLNQGIAPKRLGVAGYGSYRPMSSYEQMPSNVRDDRIEVAILNIQKDY